VRVRRWQVPESPAPRRPYRDSAVFHLALAGIIVLVAWLTGGSVAKAVAFAVIFFVVATAWSWSRWRKRLDEERRREDKRVASAGSGSR
jgi:membrane protein implicated in regulation of membrane protease activity